MTKPVRFREVGRILEGWMKSREVEDREAREAKDAKETKDGREKGVLDEAGNGAKRSG